MWPAPNSAFYSVSKWDVWAVIEWPFSHFPWGTDWFTICCSQQPSCSKVQAWINLAESKVFVPDCVQFCCRSSFWPTQDILSHRVQSIWKEQRVWILAMTQQRFRLPSSSNTSRESLVFPLPRVHGWPVLCSVFLGMLVILIADLI